MTEPNNPAFIPLDDFETLSKLFDNESAALPLDAPVLASFAKAFVISIRFWLTLGAVESSDISLFIAVASKGMFVIALSTDE